jgi:hypothetical protein
MRLAPVATLLALAACGRADVPGYSREVTPSGRVEVRYAEGLTLAPDTLTALFTIGQYVDDSSPIFADLRDVEVGADGRVYAFDVQVPEIRVYTPEGAADTVIGRGGEGPGEISRSNGLRFGNDGTLFVNDPGKRKILVLDADGRERDRLDRVIPGFGFRWGITIDTAGVLWEPWSRRVTGPEPGMTATGIFEGTTLRMLQHLDPATGARDSVELDIAPWKSYLHAYPGGQVVAGMPFAGRTLMAMDRHRRIWVSDAAGYALSRLDLAADTALTLHVAEEGPAITAEDVENWKAEWRRFQENADGLIDALTPHIPPMRPPLAQLFADDRERLWVQRTVSADHPPRWDVFSPDAELLAVVHGPPGTTATLAPLVRGERIYLLLNGEAGERYIAVAELPARLR